MIFKNGEKVDAFGSNLKALVGAIQEAVKEENGLVLDENF